MKEQEQVKKAINQLGRVRKSPALDPLDKKTIERIRKKLYTKINLNKDVKKMFLIDIIEKDKRGHIIDVFYDVNIGECEGLEKAYQAIKDDYRYLTPQKETASIEYIIYKPSNDETNHYKNEIETITYKP